MLNTLGVIKKVGGRYHVLAHVEKYWTNIGKKEKVGNSEMTLSYRHYSANVYNSCGYLEVKWKWSLGDDRKALENK